MADTTTSSTDRPISLWLDCDPGHDDAFAILLAAHHPNLQLLGVSTVHGNASLERTTWNALSVLTAIGRSDIPVYPGSEKPFCREASFAPDIHGATGLDGTDLLPEPQSQAVRKPGAVLAMRHALMNEPKGEAWLVATGALTNVALLFATFPEVVEHLKGLSIMGGAIGGGFTNAPVGSVRGAGERFGNHTPWAEFNIYCDPESAQSILSNSQLAAKTTLIPLDLTHQVFATKEVQELVLHGSGNEPPQATGPPLPSKTIRPLFHDLLIFFASTYREVFGLVDGPPLHDPIAVAAILPEDELSFDDGEGERWHVEVTTDGAHSDGDEERGQVGRTMIRKAETGGVRIPRGLQVQRFWQIINAAIAKAEEALPNT